MILSDKEIKEYALDGMITPFNSENLSAASYDITFSKEIKKFKKQDFKEVDFIADPTMGDQNMFMCNENLNDNENVYLGPHEFMLINTKEKIVLPDNIAAKVFGRSSIGRAGIQVTNAGWIDPGFNGQLTLQLYNQTPITYNLRNLKRIAQLVFFEVGDVEEVYNGKYQNQEGVTGSKLIYEYI